MGGCTNAESSPGTCTLMALFCTPHTELVDLSRLKLSVLLVFPPWLCACLCVFEYFREGTEIGSEKKSRVYEVGVNDVVGVRLGTS